MSYYDPSQNKNYVVNEDKTKRTTAKRSGNLYFTPLPGTLEEGKNIKQFILRILPCSCRVLLNEIGVNF